MEAISTVQTLLSHVLIFHYNHPSSLGGQKENLAVQVLLLICDELLQTAADLFLQEKYAYTFYTEITITNLNFRLFHVHNILR
jgi:hypothetical protein